MDWKTYKNTVQGWMAETDDGTVSVEHAGKNDDGTDRYEWEGSVGTTGGSGDAPTLEIAKARALQMHALLMSMHEQEGRSETMSFADAEPHLAHVEKLICGLRDVADRLEAGDDKGGLTGVVLVAEGVPDVFVEKGPMTAVWTSMRGGDQLVGGLRSAIENVEVLRKAKGARLQ